MAMSTQQVDVVTKQFEAQLAHYTSEKRGAHDSRIVSFLAEMCISDTSLRTEGMLRVCEFGGADGLLLAAIRDRIGENVALVNAELVEAFAPRQAHSSIRFVPTSILDAAFPDATFDVVVARHVLHHLIADTLEGTRSNQARAFAQVARIARPGGLVLLEEHVNPSVLSCRILYYLSRLATRVKLDIPAFEVTPYTVVAFMTPFQLRSMAAASSGGALIPLAEEFHPVPMPIQWRLTMLRRNSGNLFVAYRATPSLTPTA
jgi:SAM-dependent methyltransferase